MRDVALTVSELVDILNRCPDAYLVKFFKDGWEENVRVVGVADREKTVLLCTEIKENTTPMEII